MILEIILKLVHNGHDLLIGHVAVDETGRHLVIVHVAAVLAAGVYIKCVYYCRQHKNDGGLVIACYVI